MSKSIVKVAIGLLFSHARVLVGFRNSQQHQGNKYEFPGGKIEKNESPQQACQREILEEVGIHISEWLPWDQIRHEYEDVIVELNFFYSYVDDSLLKNIQSPWSWVSRHELKKLNFPEANQNIIKRLQWPDFIKISADINEIKDLDEHHILYYRPQNEPISLHDLAYDHFSKIMMNLVYAQKLSREDQKQLAAIHIRQNQLYGLHPNDLILGAKYLAACHDIDAVLYAQKLGCDAVLLSPIQKTQTHPDVLPLGFDGLKTIAEQTHLLVYALGGLKRHDLAQVRACQAYGVAGISGF